MNPGQIERKVKVELTNNFPEDTRSVSNLKADPSHERLLGGIFGRGRSGVLHILHVVGPVRGSGFHHRAVAF
jgi:hypothetical protein